MRFSAVDEVSKLVEAAQTARFELEATSLTSTAAQHYYPDHERHVEAGIEQAGHDLALKARAFVQAINALPAHMQPIGWDAEVDA